VVTALLLGAGGVGLGLAGMGSSSAVAGQSTSSVRSALPNAATVCNSPTYISDSSLLIPLPNANGTLLSGGKITAAFEFAVVATNVSTVGKSVTFPSVFVTFPLTSGTRQIDFAPTTVAFPTSGWSTATALNKTIVTTSSLPFQANTSAFLSSEKLAVMAPMNYSTLTLEFRWYWSVTQPSGVTVASAWSIPTKVNNLPSELRSIFYPAPFVSFLSSTGASATIGTNYTATLGGDVAGRYFLLEMEFPATGKVVQAQGQTAPAGATSFKVYIPVLGYSRSLAPGSYLVHIHDSCGAMLYNKAIKVTFASTATIGFSVSPASCTFQFNGSKWKNNSTAVVVPSTTPYSLGVGCPGFPFQSWSGTGGTHVENGHSLLISASGTFRVVYA
jgi:hypothetical protein